MNLNHEESLHLIGTVLRAHEMIELTRTIFEKDGKEMDDMAKRFTVVLTLAANGIYCDGVEGEGLEITVSEDDLTSLCFGLGKSDSEAKQ